mgnify:CR=1 FL=1
MPRNKQMLDKIEYWGVSHFITTYYLKLSIIISFLLTTLGTFYVISSEWVVAAPVNLNAQTVLLNVCVTGTHYQTNIGSTNASVPPLDTYRPYVWFLLCLEYNVDVDEHDYYRLLIL